MVDCCLKTDNWWDSIAIFIKYNVCPDMGIEESCTKNTSRLRTQWIKHRKTSLRAAGGKQRERLPQIQSMQLKGSSQAEKPWSGARCTGFYAFEMTISRGHCGEKEGWVVSSKTPE